MPEQRNHMVIGVPGIPPVLTDEQTRAAYHMLVNPLTIVVGPPGRGKTSMIVWAMSMWSNAAAVSFVGTNVANHRQKMGGRSETSSTAHHFYKTCKSKPEWGRAIQSFIWDEFSQVPDKLAAKVFECLPNAHRLLLVLDPHQIAPISPGCVGLDMIDAFAQETHTLSVNLRVSSHARALAEAAVQILRNEPLDWSDQLEHLESLTYVETSNQLLSFSQHVERILSHAIEHRNVRTLEDIQFISFTREMRDQCNEVVEDVLRRNTQWFHMSQNLVELRKGFWIYVGCKICIRGDNFSKYGTRFQSIRNGEIGIVSEHLQGWRRFGNHPHVGTTP